MRYQTVAPPLGRRYDVEGLHLALHRSGTGRPPVVVVPGAGLVGLDSLPVHLGVAELTTSVIYDRAGTGWSDPIRLPRTATAVAAELHELLRVAGIVAPFVFLGHSLGGGYARRFAQIYPDEVAGLLLIEPAHEDYLAYMPERVRQVGERADAAPMPEPVAAAAAGRRPAVATWPAPAQQSTIRHPSDSQPSRSRPDPSQTGRHGPMPTVATLTVVVAVVAVAGVLVRLGVLAMLDRRQLAGGGAVAGWLWVV